MNEFEKIFSAARDKQTWEIEKVKLQIAKNIHLVMKQKGVSQTELAKKTGKTQPYISQALRGQTNFTVETLVMFARALETNISIRFDSAAEAVIKKSSSSYLLEQLRFFINTKAKEENQKMGKDTYNGGACNNENYAAAA